MVRTLSRTPAALVALLLLAAQRTRAELVHQGCFTNAPHLYAPRAMPFMVATSDSMTPAACARLAANRLMHAFGVEYGR